MEFNRCYGCMEEATAFPCPHCGYTPGSKGPDYALRPGSILYGKYLVGRILGQGGFGITYIGWDLMLERKVAIKEYYPSGQVVRQSGASSLQWYGTEQATNARDSGKEMFLKEARKMNKVRKIPQVVQVLDLFQENDTAYIVMDFIEGETLTRQLKKTGPLSWHQMQEIFLPVIHAMEEVHKAGLIHRDLSPDNLMLLPDGGVQILDLGAAKDLSLNSGASSMQVAKGGFSPLEQYYQRGGSGTWTDVYALAATIYYALTGTVPPAAVERVDEDTLRWDLPRLQALPPEGVQALKKAMAIRAKDRTQTMEELYRGIAALDASEEEPAATAPVAEEAPMDFTPVVEEAPAAVHAAEKKELPPKENNIIANGSEDRRDEHPRQDRGRRFILPIAAVLVCAAVTAAVLWTSVIRPNLDYNSAIKLMEAGQYEEAIAAFEALDGYKDSAGKLEEALRITDYAAAEKLVACGETSKAAIAFGKLAGYKDAQERSFALWEEIAPRETVSAGDQHTVGLKADGTVVAVGDNLYAQCNVSDWTDIVAVSAGNRHTVGLKADGTVVAVGWNDAGQCDVRDWTNIVAVSTDDHHTVGLKADGTVVAVGRNNAGQCYVSNWQDIVAISAGNRHTVGLKSDGTVVAVGSNRSSQCDVSDWTDVVAVSTGWSHTVGLKADGIVVAVGLNNYGQCDVSNWQNIAAISSGSSHTVGLKADGTVVAVGWNENGRCNVGDWQDCVAVSAGSLHTVGLKADGTVVAVGWNEYGQCDVRGWKDMKLPK